jgi:hypothetical protein
MEIFTGRVTLPVAPEVSADDSRLWCTFRVESERLGTVWIAVVDQFSIIAAPEIKAGDSVVIEGVVTQYRMASSCLARRIWRQPTEIGGSKLPRQGGQSAPGDQ